MDRGSAKSGSAVAVPTPFRELGNKSGVVRIKPRVDLYEQVELALKVKDRVGRGLVEKIFQREDDAEELRRLVRHSLSGEGADPTKELAQENLISFKEQAEKIIKTINLYKKEAADVIGALPKEYQDRIKRLISDLQRIVRDAAGGERCACEQPPALRANLFGFGKKRSFCLRFTS